MKLAIIGVGLIGGSMAIDLRKKGFASEIIGVDKSKQNGEEAVQLGIVDRMAPMHEALPVADLVIVALPVDHLLRELPAILDLISGHTTVTDVGSTKRRIVEAVEKHPRRGNYVPSHPMAGTENSGPSAAIPNLFDGKLAILCDHQKSRPQHLALVEKMYQLLGMSIAYMTSDEQDHTTAFVSHLPHVAAFALANAVLANEERNIITDLASGGFQSTVRLAKSSPDMWTPIFHQNSDYIIGSINDYIAHLEMIRESLLTDDQTRLYNLITESNKIRGVLEGTSSTMTKKEQTVIKLYTKK